MSRSDLFEETIGVLVVDKGRSRSERMAEFLVGWGFEPVLAGGWREALRLAAQHEFPIALVNGSLRSREPLQLVESLRAIDRHMEVILLVEDYSAASAAVALQRGVSVCLPQPVDFHHLSHELNSLRNSTLQRWEGRVPEGTVPGRKLAVAQDHFACQKKRHTTDQFLTVQGCSPSDQAVRRSTKRASSACGRDS